jgi:hypothetical protein
VSIGLEQPSERVELERRGLRSGRVPCFRRIPDITAATAPESAREEHPCEKSRHCYRVIGPRAGGGLCHRERGPRSVVGHMHARRGATPDAPVLGRKEERRRAAPSGVTLMLAFPKGRLATLLEVVRDCRFVRFVSAVAMWGASARSAPPFRSGGNGLGNHGLSRGVSPVKRVPVTTWMGGKLWGCLEPGKVRR